MAQCAVPQLFGHMGREWRHDEGRGSSTAREAHFCCDSSLTHIMNAATEVLKENASMSADTFLMSLWSERRLSAEGSSSVRRRVSPFQ